MRDYLARAHAIAERCRDERVVQAQMRIPRGNVWPGSSTMQRPEGVGIARIDELRIVCHRMRRPVSQVTTRNRGGRRDTSSSSPVASVLKSPVSTWKPSLTGLYVREQRPQFDQPPTLRPVRMHGAQMNAEAADTPIRG